MGRIDEKVAGGLANISIWSSNHAKAVVFITLLTTVFFGYGVAQITTNVDVADVLPRGNYNTESAHDLTEKFRSTFTQQVTLQVHVDESGANWNADNAKLQYRAAAAAVGGGLSSPGSPAPYETGPDPNNITDEVYVRAIEELVSFIQAPHRTDFSRSISISQIYALVNWTVAGGQGRAPDEAFALPPPDTFQSAAQYNTVDYAVKTALLDTVDAISSPSWNHAATLFMPAADNEKPTRDLGLQILKARDEYVQAVKDGKTNYTVFGPENPPLFTVDLPVANAHSSELVQEDLVRLMPLIGAFILVCLFIAFRDLRAIAVCFTTLAIGVVWAYGTMGFMGIALNTLNMTIVPLVMGVGIDYGIHMINEFVEHKSEGHTDAEAFRIAGSRSGLALLIASLTTIGGLFVLVFSPSLLIAQLGLISAVALATIYVMTITFVPAALTLVGGSEKMGSSFSRSKIMPALARGVTKSRYAVLVLMVLVSGLAYVGIQDLEQEAFGDPGRNYLPDDPIRQEHEKGLAYFYEAPDSDEKANILTFQGPGILTPDAIAYYRTIEQNLKQKDRVIPDTLRTVPFFIETWLTVKNGAPGALTQVGLEQLLASGQLPGPVASEADPFPTTEEGIRDEVNQMFDSPMRELASIIVNHPRLDMAAMTFSVRAATYDEAEEVWEQVWSAVGEANKTFGGHAPEGVRVAFVGNTATNYLFIAEELPWLSYMNIASNILLGVLIFGLTRSIKITFVTLLISGLTTFWWFALLPLFGIGLAITLTLPIAFIIAIGTDYAVHFMWNIRQTGDPRGVFESTGKAVLFSFITTTGAFVFFIFLQNVAVARTMIATTIAFGVIFVVTMMAVPSFFKVQKKGEPGRGPPKAEEPKVVAAPKRRKGDAPAAGPAPPAAPQWAPAEPAVAERRRKAAD